VGNYFSECAAPNSCGALRPNGQNSPKSGPEYSVLMILTIYAKTHCTHGDYGVHELTVVSLCLYSRLCSHHPRICLSGLRHSPSRSITASLTMLRHARRPAVRGGGGSSSTAAVNIKGNDVARMPFGRRLLQTVQHPDKFLIATYQYNALTHSRQSSVLGHPVTGRPQQLTVLVPCWLPNSSKIRPDSLPLHPSVQY